MASPIPKGEKGLKTTGSPLPGFAHATNSSAADGAELDVGRFYEQLFATRDPSQQPVQQASEHTSADTVSKVTALPANLPSDAAHSALSKGPGIAMPGAAPGAALVSTLEAAAHRISSLETLRTFPERTSAAIAQHERPSELHSFTHTHSASAVATSGDDHALQGGQGTGSGVENARTPQILTAWAAGEGAVNMGTKGEAVAASQDVLPAGIGPALEYGVPRDNVGFQLLKKAGWQEGAGELN